MLARLPDNDVTSAVADAIGQAVQESRVEGGAVLMVVQPGETNAYDQQWLQLAVWERHKVWLGFYAVASWLRCFDVGCSSSNLAGSTCVGGRAARGILCIRSAVAPAGGLGAPQDAGAVCEVLCCRRLAAPPRPWLEAGVH